MKLICPKCQAQSTVPDERVPAKGAWARCPKCQDRFFIKPPAAPQPEFFQNAQRPSAAPQVRGRSPEAQKLLDRLRPKRERVAETMMDGPGGLDVITVFPTPIVPYTEFAMMFGILAIVVALVIIRGFWISGEKAVITINTPQEVGVTAAYDEKRLKTDLINLRRAMFRKGSAFYTIDYTGLESQIFNYLMADMAPAVCPKISRLKIETEKPRERVTFIGTCLDADRDTQVIELKWHDRSALITIPDKAEKAFLLFPPLAESGKPEDDEE